MLKSEIEKILTETIQGVEELENIDKSKFHSIEREIDDMANKPEANLNKVVSRAKELTVRVFDAFQGNSLWINNKWPDIERKIRKNLRELE